MLNRQIIAGLLLLASTCADADPPPTVTTQTFPPELTHHKADLAITLNSDEGVEAAIVTSGNVLHAWEKSPGEPNAYPWTKYKPGGRQVAMERDAQGRIMIAWLSGGNLMLMTEPNQRSSLSDPVTLISGRHLKSLRVSKRRGAKTLMIAALTSAGDVVVRRQAKPDSWDFVGNDELGRAGKGIRTLSATSSGDARFIIVGVGKDSKVYSIEEGAPEGTWGPWGEVGTGHNVKQAEVATDGRGIVEAIALGSDHLLYFASQTSTGKYVDWGLVSQTPAGNSFSINTTSNGALVMWGEKGNAYAESESNGAWSDGGTGRPDARVIADNKTMIDVNLFDRVDKTVTTYSYTGHQGDADCCDGYWCFDPPQPDPPPPPTECIAYEPPFQTTKTSKVKSFEVQVLRNGVESDWLMDKP